MEKLQVCVSCLICLKQVLLAYVHSQKFSSAQVGQVIKCNIRETSHPGNDCKPLCSSSRVACWQ